MKKIALLLAVLVLFSGCTTPAPQPVLQPAEEEILELEVLDGQITEGIYGWLSYDMTRPVHTRVVIRSAYEGGAYERELTYDGKFHLIEDGTERVYDYLLTSVQQDVPAGASYNYAQRWLLSDDPTMTWQRAFDHMLSSTYEPDFPETSLLFSDRYLFDLPTDFVDETLKGVMALKDGYLTKIWTEGGCTVTRWTAQGEPVCSFRLPNMPGLAAETPGGGLVVTYWEDDREKIAFLDESGNLLQVLGQLDSGAEIWSRDEDVLIFGACRQEAGGYTDCAVLRCSPEGRVLETVTWGGQDFDCINAVRAEGEGYRILGMTQSRDEAFPLSPDGYGVYYTAYLDPSLQLVSPECSEPADAVRLGWHRGEPVYLGDALPGTAPAENARPVGIVDRPDGGCTIFWLLQLEEAPAPLEISAIWYYTILLRQELDADGTQTSLVRSPVSVNNH